MICQLSPDLLENNIFFYLDGLDLVNLSILNKEMHKRLDLVQHFSKCRIREFWPVVKIRLYCKQPFEITLLDNLLEIMINRKWRFKKVIFINDYQPTITEYQLFADHIKILQQDFFTNIYFNISSEMLFNSISQNLKEYQKLKTLSITHGITPEIVLTLTELLPCTNITKIHLADDGFVAIGPQFYYTLQKSKIETLILDISQRLESNLQYVDSIGINPLTSQQDFVSITKNLQLSDIKKIGGALALGCVLPHTRINELHLSSPFFNKSHAIFAKGLSHKIKKLSVKGKEPNLFNNLSNIPQEYLILFHSRTFNEMQHVFSNLPSTELQEITFDGTMGTQTVNNLISYLPQSKVTVLKAKIPIERFNEFLSSSTTLKEFQLLSIENDEYCKLIQENIENITLDKLGIQISGKGLEYLISKLDMCNLKHLDLSNSQLGNSIPLLGIYLPLSKLESLDLSSCGISNQAIHLISGFLKYTAITNLNLERNEINRKTVDKFCLAVGAKLVASVNLITAVCYSPTRHIKTKYRVLLPELQLTQIHGTLAQQKEFWLELLQIQVLTE
ncbi:hypothetical protein HDV06_005737 [Boothiomyces sp. JEL0866]|nr:hypothetical protein HDV06_005737 [Boothiomyces sp. JEL0866]